MSDADPLTLLSVGLSEAKAAQAALYRAITALEEALQQGVQSGLNALPAAIGQASEHRRQHRSGVPSIIDSNPTLQVFILARLDRMTFKQIADEIAQHFPPNLHIHQSTIHRWFQKRR